MNEFIYTYQISIFLINFVLAVIAICGTRTILSRITGVNTAQELSQKDNFAFGIAVAGGALSIAIILLATLSGDSAATLIQETGNVAGYLVGGIILLMVGMVINDKVIFSHFSLKTAIKEHNLSAGIVQAASMIASGILIANAMEWETTGDIMQAYVILPIFFVSLIILFIISKVRGVIYSKRNAGKSLQQALAEDNAALAIRYAGHLVGTALAVGASSSWVSYLTAAKLTSVINWTIIAIIITLAMAPVAMLARRFILAGINVSEEVDQQKNIGIGIIEAVIFIAIGFVFRGLAA